MLIGGYRWLKEGNLISGIEDGKAASLALKGIGVYIFGVVVSLILAALASIAAIYTSSLIGTAGPFIGIATILILAYLLVFRDGGVVHKMVIGVFTLR